MITAMTATIVLLMILTLAILALGYYTVRVIQGDGYGTSRRQPPASHHSDIFGPRRA